MTCNNMNFSLLTKCRTCLGDPVDVSTLEALNLSGKIVPVLNFLNIKIVDGLPNTVCCECVTKLNNINSFKQLCEESQTILQNLFKEHKTKAHNTESSTDLDDNIKLEVKKENEFEEEIEDFEDTDNVNGDEWSEKEISQLKSETNENSVRDNSKNEIKSESNENNKSEPNICQICNKRFTYKKSLTKHVKGCKGPILSEKSINNRTELQSLESDIQKLPKSGDFPCAKCKFVSTSKPELDEHCQEKHDTVCNICNRKFYNHKHLRRHRETHRPDRPKQLCEICKKFYDSKATLYVHKKKFHSDNRREKTVCTLCGLAVFEIKQHLKYKHPDPESKFTCNQCEKKFKSEMTLRYHVKTHHEKPKCYNSLCPECGRLFRTAGEVKYHILRVHSNSACERNFQCGHCEKTFKTSYHCLKHERVVHLNERKYNCKICSKAFSSKSILDNHVRTHTGEKPFVCNLCTRPFAQKVALRTHLKLVHGLEVNQFYLRTKPVTNSGNQISVENK